MMRSIAIAMALILAGMAACPGAAEPLAHVGDIHDIVSVRESTQQTNNGSSGSTNDTDTITERVIAVRADGLELEYDLPQDASNDERVSNWQFPARVFRPTHGPLQLLNSAELAARVDGWLKRGDITRAACGHLIFTWNAFRIECDPQSVLSALKLFEMGPSDLRDGASYQEAGSQGSAKVTQTASGPDGASYSTTLTVDPEAVRRERVETDVGVAELMRKPLMREHALRTHAAEDISGTITITFETDQTGAVRKRTSVTRLTIKTADGTEITQTAKQTLVRRVVSRPTPATI